MNWGERLQGFENFWRIKGNSQNKRFRIASWVIFSLFLISDLMTIISIRAHILPEFKYLGEFLFFHITNILFVILSWFVTFYLLKLLRAFFIFIDPNDKIGKFIDWLYNHPIYKSLFIPYMILYILGINAMFGKFSVPLIDLLFSKDFNFFYFLFFILTILISNIYLLFGIRDLLLEILKIKENSWDITKDFNRLLTKINSYFIIALGLLITILIGGLFFLNQFGQHELPLNANNQDLSIECSNKFQELINNLPLKCTLIINKSSQNSINLTNINFSFMLNNGSEEELSININHSLVKQVSTINIPNEAFILKELFLYYNNPNQTGYKELYNPVYTYSNYQSRTEDKYFWVFGLLSICFFTIFAGVNSIKQILEKN